MCKEVVEWLRERARQVENVYINKNRNSDATCREAEMIAKIADEIEQRFVLPAQLRQLTSVPRKLEGVTIVNSVSTKRRKLNSLR